MGRFRFLMLAATVLGIALTGWCTVHASQTYGPGDVLRIDPRHIAVVKPIAGGLADPNCPSAQFYYPNGSGLIPTTEFLGVTMEFDQSSFPWLYSPGFAQWFSGSQSVRRFGNPQIQPWIALVVLTAGQFHLQPTISGAPDPAVEVTDPTVLPDLTSWRVWAHSNGCHGEPGLACLDGPSTLQPGTSYWAFLVPTFLSGSLAGLGEDGYGKVLPARDSTMPAWRKGAQAVDLPYYYTWSFRTYGLHDRRPPGRPPCEPYLREPYRRNVRDGGPPIVRSPRIETPPPESH